MKELKVHLPYMRMSAPNQFFFSHFPIYTAWLFGPSGTAIADLQHGTLNTAMLRQTAATRKSSCSTIHRRSSLGLSGYPSCWAPPGSDSPLRDPSLRSAKKEAQHHHSDQLLRPWRRCFLKLTLSATHTGLHCSRSEWHHDRSFEWRRDRSLQVVSLTPCGIAIARSDSWVASQSLAVFDFRRLHCSNPHGFSSLKLHLSMGEEFSVKQQSQLQKKLWAQTIAFWPSTPK